MNRIKTVLIAFSVALALSCCAPAGAQAQAEQTEKEVLLESVGTLAASNMYLSYLSITMTWQAIETLDREQQVDDLLSPVESSLGIVRTNLGKVLESAQLTAEDEELIADIDTACALMKSAIGELKQYARTKSNEDKNKFAKRHAQIGEALDKIFGTKETDQTGSDEE